MAPLVQHAILTVTTQIPLENPQAGSKHKSILPLMWFSATGFQKSYYLQPCTFKPGLRKYLEFKETYTISDVSIWTSAFHIEEKYIWIWAQWWIRGHTISQYIFTTPNTSICVFRMHSVSLSLHCIQSSCPNGGSTSACTTGLPLSAPVQIWSRGFGEPREQI